MKQDDQSLARRPGRRLEAEQAVGIQSVEIAFSVLSAVRSANQPASLVELSERTGLAPSKLHRYLVSLTRTGLLARSPTAGTYDLGPEARSIGSAALTRFDGFAHVSETLDQLSRTQRVNAFIYLWTDAGPTLVRAFTPLPTVFSLRLGSSLPLIDSACGPVFLAYLPEATTQTILDHNLAISGVGPQVGEDRLPPLLQRIREEGIYWRSEAALPGYSACAVPVFQSPNDLLCVAGVALPDERAAEAPALIAALLRAAEEMSGAFWP